MTPGVKPLIAGNWKMNGLKSDLDRLRKVEADFPAGLADKVDILFCLPATLIAPAVQSVSIPIGGEDCHTAKSGAHTGDISAMMLRDAGATAVIVGHSERRTDHGETDTLVSEKTQAVVEEGLLSILCIGESEDERKSGKTLDVLSAQLAGSIPSDIGSDSLVVAYEPVWAIGTGLVPSVSDVAEAHAHIRTHLINRFADAGSTVRILYGGSVKPSNAGKLMAIENVDGALVGGASLKADDFLGICRAYDQI